MRRLAPTLLELRSCGVLSAAKIVGETAGVARFRSKATFARWNGTAPIPVSSGRTDRQRLNRGGNGVNAALHRIAITQWRGVGDQRRANAERAPPAHLLRHGRPPCLRHHLVQLLANMGVDTADRVGQAFVMPLDAARDLGQKLINLHRSHGASITRRVP